MKSKYQIEGIIVPIISPLNTDETIDELSLRRCLRYVLDAQVHGIFVNSTTGEAVNLLDSEQQRAIKIAIDEVKKQTPLFWGVSDTCTRRVLKKVEFANNLDIDAIVLHPYFFYILNHQSELIDFYKTISAASKHPLMLYNIPSTTKIHIAPEVVRELIQIENIIGIKDSSVDFLYLLKLIKLKKERPDFKIFIGKSHLWTSGILEGADGGLDGLSNLVPGLCVQLYNLIKSRQIDAAYQLQHQLNEIWQVYECGSFLSGIKTAMSLMGLCSNTVTHPNL
ncbi:dihydrodipicolinate synthase family protein, partial [candidate division KSB1 bacterium]|nr:dihydrodipicolinate synthase family protein [candidate division KSB1 bacterium]